MSWNLSFSDSRMFVDSDGDSRNSRHSLHDAILVKFEIHSKSRVFVGEKSLSLFTATNELQRTNFNDKVNLISTSCIKN